ncbi:MAG: hypothetical protein AAGH46_05030 [Bacteroidota bacterium]
MCLIKQTDLINMKRPDERSKCPQQQCFDPNYLERKFLNKAIIVIGFLPNQNTPLFMHFGSLIKEDDCLMLKYAYPSHLDQRKLLIECADDVRLEFYQSDEHCY